MRITNFSLFSDQELFNAFCEIKEIEQGLATYGLVSKEHKEIQKTYPEYEIRKVAYSFLREIARRWVENNPGLRNEIFRGR